MNSSNLTRSEYYRENKLPLISITHKLKPELPVLTHLLQVMPRLATELEKIESKKGFENKTNLELANAMKIINELEDELEVVTSKCNDYEDEILCHESNVRELETKVRKNEETIVSLQNAIQKSEFTAKSKLEYDKEYFNNILNEYEKKYEEMSEAYEQLKFDRERELQKAKTFHEDNIFQINMKAREFENSTQSDIKKLQREIEKGIELNTLLRQNLTDLEIFNQGQIRSLERVNAELSHTNLKLKTEHDHIIISQNTHRGLSENKIKELEDVVNVLERELRNEKSLWQEEKKILENRCFETEKNERISFNENKKQVERVQEELNRKTILLAEREREENSLKYKIERLELTVANLIQEKERMTDDHESIKREITEALTLDHYLKIDEIRIENGRLVYQEIQKAIRNERAQLENYYTVEISKYAESNRRLEKDQNKYLQAVMIAEDLSKKLEENVIALKNEIQELNYEKREITEKLQFEIKQIKEELEGKLKKEQENFQKEIGQMESERSIEEFRLKESYDLVIRELNGVIVLKRTQIEELKGKQKQQENEYAFEKSKFEVKIQDLEANFAIMRSLNERLARNNQDLEIKVDNNSSLRRKSEKTIDYEIEIEKDLLESENSFLAKEKLIIRKEFEEYRQKAETEISELQKNEKERILNYRKLEEELVSLSHKLYKTELTLSKITEEKTAESERLCLLKEELHQIEVVLENEKETFNLHVSELEITKNNLENLLLLANEKLHSFSEEHEKLLNEKNSEIEILRNNQKAQSAESSESEKEVENQEEFLNEINEENSKYLEAELSEILEQKFNEKIRKLEEEIKFLIGQKMVLENTLAQFNEESEQQILAIKSELKIHYQNEIELKEKKADELKNECLITKELSEEIKIKNKWLTEENNRLTFNLFEKNEENCCLKSELESLIKEFEKKEKQMEILNEKWKVIFEKFILSCENFRKDEIEEIKQASFEKLSRQRESEKIHRTEKSDRSWKSGKVFYSMIKNSPKTHSKETDENENENNISKIDERCSANYFNCQNNEDRLQKSINMIASELYSVQPGSAIKKHVVKLKNNSEEKEFQENMSILSNLDEHFEI